MRSLTKISARNFQTHFVEETLPGLYCDKVFSDVSLVSEEGKYFSAHRNILISVSPVLRRIQLGLPSRVSPTFHLQWRDGFEVIKYSHSFPGREFNSCTWERLLLVWMTPWLSSNIPHNLYKYLLNSNYTPWVNSYCIVLTLRIKIKSKNTSKRLFRSTQRQIERFLQPRYL